MTCRHYNILTYYTSHSIEDGSILSVGEWSERGCQRNDNLSNASVTVCECNHLTHFAILLSAKPLNITTNPAITISLQIIGYVGVTVSLVAMALTVFTFIAFK